MIEARLQILRILSEPAVFWTIRLQILRILSEPAVFWTIRLQILRIPPNPTKITVSFTLYYRVGKMPL